MALVDPVIVVPGITATYLRDDYQLPPEFIWKVIRKDYERVALHPDDRRFEAIEPAVVRSDQLYEIAYKELIEELRYNLSERADAPVSVYPFGYDWRQPLDVVERQLGSFIREVIARTKLQKHYHDAGYARRAKVNILAHSMGGLITAGYIQRTGERSRVNKVVTLATPFQGSFEAVIKVATGTANLGTSAPSSRERESARVTPALYHLLPSFSRGVTTAPGLPKSLFNPRLWQPSILETLASYVRKHSVDADDPETSASELFAEMLADAEAHRKRANSLKLADAGLSKNDWLAVVGVDATTRVQLHVRKIAGQPDFDFRSSDRRNDWGRKGSNRNPRLTGDGTVPFEGAIPKFLQERNLVLVTPEDYGYWELQDKATTKLAGFHGILPNMNMLHRLIVRFIKGTPDPRDSTWGRAAPGVDKWEPPIPGLKQER